MSNLLCGNCTVSSSRVTGLGIRPLHSKTIELHSCAMHCMNQCIGSKDLIHTVHDKERPWWQCSIFVDNFLWITKEMRYSHEFSCVKETHVSMVAITCNWNMFCQSNKSFIVIVIAVQNYHMQLHVRIIIQFKGIFSLLLQASLIAVFVYVVLRCSKKLWC